LPQEIADDNAMKQLLLSVLLATLALTLLTPVDAEGGVTKRTRYTSVERLLQSSSAARLVSESGNAEAMALHAEANVKFELARQAHESGDTDAANDLLDEAVRLLYSAVGIVNKSAPGQDKESRDFENRRKSVVALITAHNRIADEKGLDRERREMDRQAAIELQIADELFASGETAEARQHLDTIYDAVKISIEEMREGETLVRELKFSSPEDEYKYELDRNDTHQMLVKILLNEKMDQQSVRDRVAPFIVTADQFRVEAEAMAADNNFEQAIELLEKSTGELVKAIRGAGVYIPG